VACPSYYLASRGGLRVAIESRVRHRLFSNLRETLRVALRTGVLQNLPKILRLVKIGLRLLKLFGRLLRLKIILEKLVQVPPRAERYSLPPPPHPHPLLRPSPSLELNLNLHRNPSPHPTPTPVQITNQLAKRVHLTNRVAGAWGRVRDVHRDGLGLAARVGHHHKSDKALWTFPKRWRLSLLGRQQLRRLSAWADTKCHQIAAPGGKRLRRLSELGRGLSERLFRPRAPPRPLAALETAHEEGPG
jgi:hypothetical protein